MREGDSFRDIHEPEGLRDEWAFWYATMGTEGEDICTALRRSNGCRAAGKVHLRTGHKSTGGEYTYTIPFSLTSTPDGVGG